MIKKETTLTTKKSSKAITAALAATVVMISVFLYNYTGGPINENWLFERLITINNKDNVDYPSWTSIVVNLDTETLISQGKLAPDCSNLAIVYFNEYGSNFSVNYAISPPDFLGKCNTTATKIVFLTYNAIEKDKVDTSYKVFYGGNQNISNSAGYAYRYYFDFNTPDTANIVQYNLTKIGTGTVDIYQNRLRLTGLKTETTGVSIGPLPYLSSDESILAKYMGEYDKSSCQACPTNIKIDKRALLGEIYMEFIMPVSAGGGTQTAYFDNIRTWAVPNAGTVTIGDEIVR